LELKQNGVNPEQKSVYRELTDKIKMACCRYTNQMAVCKTHFKKTSAKSRAKPKAKAATVPKTEEGDDK